jgi:hypothetical protein
MSKDAFYFPHDAGARNDLKIVRLRRKYDHQGVGIYWCIIELLREANEDGYRIRCSQQEDIAYDLRFDIAIFEDLITDDPENSLLVSDGEWFWSESLIRRMTPLDEKRRKLSEAGKKGGRPRKKARLKPGLSQVKANRKPTESKESRVEESRIDQSKEDPPIPPKGFDAFWKAYPKRVGKQAAVKAWKRASKNGLPPITDLLAILEKQKASSSWLKDNGQFIPNPTTWLNQGRWEDEIKGEINEGSTTYRGSPGNRPAGAFEGLE